MKTPLFRRASERGHAEHGWLDTRYSFSFADYRDGAWMGFRSLRVINEDRIAPGKGFDLHGHRDMEILTYVMRGSLRHVDTMGNNEVLHTGEFQMMTAGSGIRHMEINASPTEECHLYQVWILPSRANLEPGYAQKPISALPAYSLNAGPGALHVIPGEDPGSSSIIESSESQPTGSTKTLIASPDGRDGSLTIHQDAEVWLWRLGAGEKAALELPEGKAAWIQVVKGEVEVGGEGMGAGDAAGVAETIGVATAAGTELMIFIL